VRLAGLLTRPPVRPVIVWLSPGPELIRQRLGAVEAGLSRFPYVAIPPLVAGARILTPSRPDIEVRETGGREAAGVTKAWLPRPGPEYSLIRPAFLDVPISWPFDRRRPVARRR